MFYFFCILGLCYPAKDISFFSVVSITTENLEEMAKQLDYIKKLVDAKNTLIEQKNAVISDLQIQRAECLREIDYLNNKLKEQSPLIDMDNMKGANQ